MKQIFSAFLLLFAIQTTIAQTLSPTVVRHSGIHYERLSQIDTLLKQYVDKNWLAGAVVLVVKFAVGKATVNVDAPTPV